MSASAVAAWVKLSKEHRQTSAEGFKGARVGAATPQQEAVREVLSRLRVRRDFFYKILFSLPHATLDRFVLFSCLIWMWEQNCCTKWIPEISFLIKLHSVCRGEKNKQKKASDVDRNRTEQSSRFKGINTFIKHGVWACSHVATSHLIIAMRAARSEHSPSGCRLEHFYSLGCF